MVMTNIAVAGLESYQPAVDYKRSGRIGVLSGKNFAWDASGVYSAYASRLIDGATDISNGTGLAQTLDFDDLIHVALDGQIWKLNPVTTNAPTGTWEDVDTLATLVESDVNNVPYDYRRWTTGFLGNKRYACAYNYGVFLVTPGTPDTYTRLTDGTVTGFPADSDPVIFIGETNGRMMYITSTTIYWSGANDPEDLSPALGGAGFQVINERIAGIPIALTPVANGALLWTTAGCLVCEFIGGDAVFRFYQLSTQALPTSSYSITRLPDDDYVILTRLGLFMLNNLSQPQPISPLFNEFLREQLRTRPTDYGHVWYSINDNRLYVSMRANTNFFRETYGLDLVLDRWGVFNEAHRGMFKYGLGRGQLGYMDSRGVASYLLSSIDPRKNRESSASPGTLVGLSSEIVIGYLRAENLVGHADVVQEVVEILVNRALPFKAVTVEYVDEGFFSDYGTGDVVDEGFFTDYGSGDSVDEGLFGEQSAPTNYRLQLITDIFTTSVEEGMEDRIDLDLARVDAESDLWVGTLPAIYHRLQFIAADNDEYFRVNSLDLTAVYSGNLS